MDKLSCAYPEISFEYKWADEDFGYNTGTAKLKGGKTLNIYIPEGGSKEALELSANVHDINLAEEGYLYNENTRQYEYVDEGPDCGPKMDGV